MLKGHHLCSSSRLRVFEKYIHPSCFHCMCKDARLSELCCFSRLQNTHHSRGTPKWKINVHNASNFNWSRLYPWVGGSRAQKACGHMNTLQPRDRKHPSCFHCMCKDARLSELCCFSRLQNTHHSRGTPKWKINVHNASNFNWSRLYPLFIVCAASKRGSRQPKKHWIVFQLLILKQETGYEPSSAQLPLEGNILTF